MTDDNKTRETDREWEQRVLCSDESCIGTVGPDGRCRECGRLHEGPLPGISDQPPAADETAASNGEPASPIEDAAVATAEQTPADESPDALSDEEWERRMLCEDESCIGTIGPDGLCTECGKPHSKGA